MVNYPAQIDNSLSIPVSVDNNTPVTASVTNKLREAIIAIESELGVKPGGVSTVRARFASLEATLENLDVISLSGDLGGTVSSPLVIGIQGNPISDETPSSNDVLTWTGLAWEPFPITFPSIVNADISASAAIAVSKLAAGTNGYILTTSGGIPTWATPAAGFTAGGDLTGTSSSQQVVSLTGTGGKVTIPTAGLAYGTLPSLTGDIRFPNGTSIILGLRNAGDSDDLSILAKGTGADIYIGCDSGFASVIDYINQYCTTAMDFGIAGVSYINLNGSAINIGTRITNESTATYGNFVTALVEVATTDDTITNIYTWTITDEATTVADVIVTAVTDDGVESDGWKGTIMFNRNGGTVTAGTPVTSQLGASAWVFTLDNSTSTGRVRVTGEVATNINWVATVRLQITTAA